MFQHDFFRVVVEAHCRKRVQLYPAIQVELCEACLTNPSVAKERYLERVRAFLLQVKIIIKKQLLMTSRFGRLVFPAAPTLLNGLAFEAKAVNLAAIYIYIYIYSRQQSTKLGHLGSHR